MRCNKCGSKVKTDVTFCTHCGNRIDVNGTNTENNAESQLGLGMFKPYKRYVMVGLATICFGGYFISVKCESGLCLLPSVLKGEYCIVHTCNVDSCINKKATSKDFCYTHSPTNSPNISYTPEVAEDVIVFSNIEITHNSSYTICTATITNNGRKTYTFVEVKGKFKDSSGIILNTDWTYAVGSEGLEPGETTTLRLSVDKNAKIQKCELEILDYVRE